MTTGNWKYFRLFERYASKECILTILILIGPSQWSLSSISSTYSLLLVDLLWCQNIAELLLFNHWQIVIDTNSGQQDAVCSRWILNTNWRLYQRFAISPKYIEGGIHVLDDNVTKGTPSLCMVPQPSLPSAKHKGYWRMPSFGWTYLMVSGLQFIVWLTLDDAVMLMV